MSEVSLETKISYDCWQSALLINFVDLQGRSSASEKRSGLASPLLQHRFTSPEALLQSIEDPCEQGTAAVVQALAHMSQKPQQPQPRSGRTARRGWRPTPQQMTVWLGIVNAVGRLVHRMLVVAADGKTIAKTG